MKGVLPFLTVFPADEGTFDAVVRNLEIIEEAAKNLPQEVCDRKIDGLRDILSYTIHAYYKIGDINYSLRSWVNIDC